MGDDVLDLQFMIPIREASGIVGCLAGAVEQVKDISDYMSLKDGRNGAVRELVVFIINDLAFPK